MVKVTLRVTQHEDETAVSLASRLAAANGVLSLVEFCRLIGISYAKVAMGVTDEIRRFFDIVGGDAALADKCQPRSIDDEKRFLIAGDRVTQSRLRTRTVRFCPLCLEEDMATAEDRPILSPYGRVAWYFRAFRTCPTHGHAIIELPPLYVNHGVDFHGTIRKHLATLGRFAECSQGRSSKFEDFLLERLSGQRRAGRLLDAIGVNGAITMSEHLGTLVEFGPRYRLDGLDERAMAQATNSGFEILRGGPGVIRSALIALEHHQGRRPSVLKTWGQFYTCVEQYRGDDIEPLKSVLRELLLERYPKKVGSVLLDQLVTTEAVAAHSLKSTAKTIGVTAEVLRKMSGRPAFGDAKGSTPGFVSSQELGSLAEVVARLVPSAEVPAKLQVTYDHYSQLRRAGMIKPSQGVSRYFDEAALNDFVTSVGKGAKLVRSPPPGSVALPDLSRIAIPARLVELVRKGSFRTFWYVATEVGLRKIWLNEAEVIALSKLRGKPKLAP
jgi:hypothetical protein